MANIVNSYKDKFIGADDRLSVMDILQKVGTDAYKQQNRREFEAVGIDYVKINGNKFTNYGQYQFIWEKSYVKSPERSAGGSIDNLDSYATFLTPHLILNFSVMSIDDYRHIMLLHHSANEFTVECYDPIYNQTIVVNMYFATEEMAKLYTIAQHRLLPNGQWEEWVDIAGVTEYTVEMIGTNTEPYRVEVTYYLNPPSDTSVADDSIVLSNLYKGQSIIVGAAASNFVSQTFNDKYVFTKWSTNKAGGVRGNYLNDYEYTINNSLVLYAQWQKTT